MKMRKFLSVALTLLLVSTMVTFANGNQDEVSVDEPLTVRMLYPDNSSYPIQDDWLVFEEIERATGVNLELIVAPDNSADFEAKKQIIFASGDIPEIVYSKYQASSEDVANGLLLPINMYLDKMPNLKNFLATYDYDADIANLTESDGNFYTLPIKADTVRQRIHSWMIRVDVFEKNGIPVPTTLDEVTAAGLKLKELYPDSSPVINRFGAGNFLSILGFGFGTSAGWALSTNGYTYDDDTETFVFAPTSAEYKELLEYTNNWYKTGILDPEFGTLDSSAYEQRVIQGDTFILLDWVGNQVRYNVNGQEIDPDFNVQPIFPPKGPRGDYASERAPMYEQFWVLPATLAENPRFDEILEFIDWFYSEEAAIITTFGLEGETYTEEDGHLVFVDPSNDYTRSHGLINNALNVRRHPDWFLAMNGAEVGALFAEMGEAQVNLPPEPRVRYNEEEIDDLKLLVPTISDYYNSMLHKFIFGEENFDDDWDNFVNECEAKESIEIGEIINSAWNRQNQ